MSHYVDFYVMPIPKKRINDYKAMAKASAKIWMKAGALEYYECLADDVPKGKITSFHKSVKLKTAEVLAIGYAVYKSRAHRDRVMAKVHQDEVMLKMWDDMPFDGMRMIWGGFKGFVKAKKRK